MYYFSSPKKVVIPIPGSKDCPVVVTANRAIALLFIENGVASCGSFAMHKKEIVIIEHFPGYLEQKYAGATGYIYGIADTSNDFRKRGESPFTDEFVSDVAITPSSCEYIPNCLESLKKANIKVLRYADIVSVAVSSAKWNPIPKGVYFVGQRGVYSSALQAMATLVAGAMIIAVHDRGKIAFVCADDPATFEKGIPGEGRGIVLAIIARKLRAVRRGEYLNDSKPVSGRIVMPRADVISFLDTVLHVPKLYDLARRID